MSVKAAASTYFAIRPPLPFVPLSDAFGLVQHSLGTGEANNGFPPLDIHSVPRSGLRGVPKRKGYPRPASRPQWGTDGRCRREGAGLHCAQRRRQARHALVLARRRPDDPVLLRMALHERVPRPALLAVSLY